MDKESQTRKTMRREQESQLRRREIMLAARTLFIEKGFRNTTLDEIAEQSAFGKGTIYNYFANKDDLFHAIIDQLIDETFAETRVAMQQAGDDARAQVSAYARASVLHFHTNNEVFLMIMREHNQLVPQMMEKFFHRYLEKLTLISKPLETGMRAGAIRPGDPQKLAALFDGMIRTYCLAGSQGLWPSGNQSPEDAAALLVSVFFDGIENNSKQG
ncbi:MAG TPA: TetR/AcrR family transcriptional regulator [bacterium]|jgi:AcrR family transcriptional regulator